jgi:glyoxylase-like metal-dependent hydrolase (beta-lactamase superfamily II)
MVGLKVDHVRLVVCTHAHSDHYGQAASIVERAGCELWMHPDHAHMTANVDDPEAAVERRLEIARSAGVPEEPLRQWAHARKGQSLGIAGIVEPARELLPGVTVPTDLGAWEVVLTPGHAPSHVCLWQPERRLLISGDHLLGRVSPYYDYGYTPDPAGEFLTSLDRVETLDARLCLAGHGRTFTDVQGHIAANRELIGQRLSALEEVLRADGPVTAFDAVPRVFGEAMTPMNANWWLSETLCYLRHLQVTGRAEGDGARPERWRSAA